MAGFALYRRYRNQFEKLMGIVARDFLTALKEDGPDCQAEECQNGHPKLHRVEPVQKRTRRIATKRRS